jgi:hypothetical protein
MSNTTRIADTMTYETLYPTPTANEVRTVDICMDIDCCRTAHYRIVWERDVTLECGIHALENIPRESRYLGPVKSIDLIRK